MLPPDVQCSKEARDLMLECCVEFVHLLATESNEICDKSSKKTIGVEHMLAAFKSLGYADFVDQVVSEQTLHTKEQKERESKRSAASKFGDTGMTQEELAKQQEELFKAAREKYQQRLATPTTETPPQLPSVHISTKQVINETITPSSSDSTPEDLKSPTM